MKVSNLPRLFIQPHRIISSNHSRGKILLNKNESHYLSRVMRLRQNDPLAVLDGEGHLWNSVFITSEEVALITSYDSPNQTIPRPYPSLCLAVSLPKRGFDDALRMSCEIGIDTIQPLNTSRRSLQVLEKTKRWESIIRESVEQSERLWAPTILRSIHFEDWMPTLSSSSAFALSVTRKTSVMELDSWLSSVSPGVNQIWVAIGPEGGWTREEESIAINSKADLVKFGNSILRTSTAIVVASHVMTSHRTRRSND